MHAYVTRIRDGLTRWELERDEADGAHKELLKLAGKCEHNAMASAQSQRHAEASAEAARRKAAALMKAAGDRVVDRRGPDAEANLALGVILIVTWVPSFFPREEVWLFRYGKKRAKSDLKPPCELSHRFAISRPRAT